MQHYCFRCGRWTDIDSYTKLCPSCYAAAVTVKSDLKPAVLDLCCGAGGAARGYVQAGFEVWGSDISGRLERDYLRSGASRFIRADVLELLADTWFVKSFDFIHASVPCQRYSKMSRCRPGLAAQYPDLIGPVRDLLLKTGRPFVLENVADARPWLQDPITLCGQMFGRPVYRHRLFEPGGGISLVAPRPAARHLQTADRLEPGLGPGGAIVPATAPPGAAHSASRSQVNKECGWSHPVPAAKAGHWRPGMYVSVSGHERREPVREAMAIDWMANRDDVKEAVPPYMTLEIGRQVLEQLAA